MRAWPAGIGFGGDYNPEQWPRETWLEDMRLMREAGVTFVSLGIFSWSWLEPAKGEYEFGWLDDIMGLLAENDIAVDLATATATPPPWLSTSLPQILPVDADGHTLSPGSRQAWCPNSDIFREHALALTTQMAQRYHEHPALAMWHVSNEYACHNVPCLCDTCAAAFRTWLQRRYADLGALNEAWGTAFWSQRYTAWEQILPPRRTTAFHNPTQVLDYKRFQSDSLLDVFRAEKAVLAEHSPGVPVTTNFMTLTGFRHLDYWAWAPEQDIVSTDHYRVDTLPYGDAELAFSGDLTRGLAGGRPWMLMEHSTSAVNWQPFNHAKPLGGTLRDSVAHVARGADGVGYFQWRASRAGAEKYHSAMVPHAGEHSRRFREVCHLGAVLERLREVAGSRVEAPVAILFDYQAQWSVEGPCMPATLDYPQVAHTVHRLLRERGIACDVVHPGADLTAYRLIVVPTLYLVSEDNAKTIEAAATAGAHVLVSYFSGIVDEDDHVRLGGYPGAFAELLGVRVEEFFPLHPGETVRLRGGGQGSVWTEDVTLTTAHALGHYDSGPLSGEPALTRRDLGAGSATYLSTLPDDATLDDLLADLVQAAGISPVHSTPPGVAVTRRRNDDGSWLFFVNDTDTAQRVDVRGRDLVTDETVFDTLTLQPNGVAVIREE